MIKEINLVNSDVTLNSTRILIMIAEFSNKKSFKMNINKIMLFDFYMKFPKTMLNDTDDLEYYDFNEFYSFYHWQPDRERYQIFLKYLLSKNLIEKRIIKNDFCYFVTERGNEAVSMMNSEYSKELNKIATYIRKELSNLSDKKIEENILKFAFEM